MSCLLRLKQRAQSVSYGRIWRAEFKHTSRWLPQRAAAPRGHVPIDVRGGPHQAPGRTPRQRGNNLLRPPICLFLFQLSDAIINFVWRRRVSTSWSRFHERSRFTAQSWSHKMGTWKSNLERAKPLNTPLSIDGSRVVWQSPPPSLKVLNQTKNTIGDSGCKYSCKQISLEMTAI